MDASDPRSRPMTTDATLFWEEVHAARPPADPRPNARLVEIVSALPPGDALDLGCGNGGDARWLASRGWTVTATDISAVAVNRLSGPRLTAVRHDLRVSFPAGEFDLVTAHYLQTPFELDRTTVLRTAAYALRPGGRLLVVDHGSIAPWSWNQDPDLHFPSPAEIAADLALDPAQWTVERADSPTRLATGPGGQTAEVVDHVLLIRRAV
ncbi:methyltransferase [Streptomyces sp. AA4]|nr:methyltransferase [Streptomyces sp. AA4]